MSSNSISKNTTNEVKIIHSRDDINSLQNLNNKAKSFLNSTFDKLDTENGKADGILQKSEGEIYVFDDGSISVMKDGVFMSGMSMQGAEAQMIGDTLQVRFSDGAESNIKDGKLVSGKTNKNRAFVKEGNNIVFEDTLKQTTTENEVKVEKKKEKPASSGSINGVKKQTIDDIANKYIEMKSSNDYKNMKYADWVKQKDDFNNKYQKLFKKFLGAPSSYKITDIHADNYKLSFSPIMDPLTMKYSWELYNVEEVK